MTIPPEELQQGWRNAGARVLSDYRSRKQRTPTDAQSFNRKNDLGLTYLGEEQTLVADGGASDIVYVSEDVEVSVSVRLNGAFGARVGFSNAPLNDIKSGNGDFAPWDLVEVNMLKITGATLNDDQTATISYAGRDEVYKDIIKENANAVRLYAFGGGAEAHLLSRRQ